MLADTQAIAFMLSVRPGTVRSWASRGHLHRRGTRNGRALYDVDEAGELAERIRRAPSSASPPSSPSLSR